MFSSMSSCSFKCFGSKALPEGLYTQWQSVSGLVFDRMAAPLNSKWLLQWKVKILMRLSWLKFIEVKVSSLLPSWHDVKFCLFETSKISKMSGKGWWSPLGIMSNQYSFQLLVCDINRSVEPWNRKPESSAHAVIHSPRLKVIFNVTSNKSLTHYIYFHSWSANAVKRGIRQNKAL